MYAIISDTHLGLSTSDQRVFDVAERYRASGYTVVWLGDVFDLWVDPEAGRRYAEQVFRPGDIYVMGNHDYGYRPPEYVQFYPRGVLLKTKSGSWFVTHGDILDFPYLVALFKQGYSPLSRIKRWSGGEYENLYRVLASMPREAWSDLTVGRFNLRLLGWLVLLFYAALQPAPEVQVYEKLEPGPLIPQDAETVARRVEAFFPEAKTANGIVLGHLHKPMRGEVDGRVVQVLGAWCDHWPRTVGVIDGKGFRLEVFDA